MANVFHIFIDDVISSEVNFAGSDVGISAKFIKAELAKAKEQLATKIVLHINSPGGEVYEGFSIYNQITSLGLPVESYVEGFCASIATLIMLAGKVNEVFMAPTSQLLFHKPSTQTAGTIEQHRSSVETLQNIEDLMAKRYAEKISSVTGTELNIQNGYELMNKGDYSMNPETAKNVGIINYIQLSISAIAQTKNNINKMKKPNKLVAFLATLLADVNAEIINEGPTLGVEKLADGETEFHFDGDKIEVGTKVFLDAEMTKPAGAGEHVLESGTICTLDEASVCIELREVVLDNSEELATATARIEELETEVETAKAESTSAEAKFQTKFKSLETKIKQLQALVLNEEVVVAGDKTPKKKTVSGTFTKARGMEDFAAKFQAKIDQIAK